MLHRQVSGLPVLDEHGHLVGILTEGDLLRRPELGTCSKPAGWMKGFAKSAALAAEYVHTHGRRVGDVMTPNPTFVRPEMKLAKAIELMLAKRVKRLPVVSGDTLVGVISRFDLLTALESRLAEPTTARSDAEIAADFTTALAAEPWAPRTGLSVEVEEGTVTLRGTVFSAEEARALAVLAENLPGVRAVHEALDLREDLRHAIAD